MIVAVALLWVPLLICIAIGLSGNAQVTKSVNTVSDRILDTLTLVHDNAEFAYLSVAALNSTAAVDLGDFLIQVQDVIDKGQDVKRQVVYWNGQREIIVSFGYYLPLIALVFAIIGVAAKLFRFSYLFVAFCFVCSFVIWISFAFHLPLGQISHDACADANVYVANPASIPGLSSCLNSGVSSSVFTGVLQQIQLGLTTLKNQTAPNIDDRLPPSSASTVDTIINLANFVRNQTSLANATVSMLPNSLARTLAFARIFEINVYADILEKLAIITSCDYFRGLLQGLLDDGCDPLQEGLRYIAATAAAIGVLLIPCTYLFMAMFNQLLAKGEGPKVLQRGATNTEILSTRVNPAQPLDDGHSTELAGQPTTTSAGVGYV